MRFPEDRLRPFAARSTGRSVVVFASLLLSILLSVFLAGCPSARRGWDLDALLGEYPAIAGPTRHRLADMLPYPSFENDQVVMLACRFPAGETIRVAGDGPGWPEAWAGLAVRALDRGARGFALELRTPAGEPGLQNDLEIQITSIDPANGTGPRGLADTLSECDVSRKQGGRGEVRGVLVRSEIRIKRAGPDWRGQVRQATAEEWVGALMHEIAHALGFAGHAAMGDSILVREESRLRSAGRRVLAGEAWRDETLEALYQLRPGQRLGIRSLTADAVSTLAGIRELVKRDSLQSSRTVEIRSSVGDWQARVEWLLSGGRRLSVRLMYWRDELRSGGEISLLPDTRTRRALERLARHLEEPEEREGREDSGLLVD
jgi:hypothetical protein